MPAGNDEPAPRTRPTTIRDVAGAAGVSVGTVSKALNGGGRLRPETRARILREAERLEFRPNDLIKSLLRGRTFTVGLITQDYFGRFNMPILAGIEDAFADTNILVFLCNERDDPERERNIVASLLAKQVDGIIVMGRRVDLRTPISLGRSEVPVVYAFATVPDESALCLLPDDAQGGRLAAEHLISLRRRRFALITGPREREAVAKRRAGTEAALTASGLSLPEELALTGEWSERWGYDAVHEVMRREPRADAIVCGSDLIARGVIDGLHELGVSVPDAVSVVGFDNWDIIATASRPPMTTIDMNLQTLGFEAGQRLLARIEGDRASGRIQLPCSLVVRESTAPLGSGSRSS